MPSLDHRLGYAPNIELLGEIRPTSHLYTPPRIRRTKLEEAKDKLQDVMQTRELRHAVDSTFRHYTGFDQLPHQPEGGYLIPAETWTSKWGHVVTREQIQNGAFVVSLAGTVWQQFVDPYGRKMMSYYEDPKANGGAVDWFLSEMKKQKFDWTNRYQIIPGNIYGY